MPRIHTFGAQQGTIESMEPEPRLNEEISERLTDIACPVPGGENHTRTHTDTHTNTYKTELDPKQKFFEEETGSAPPIRGRGTRGESTQERTQIHTCTHTHTGRCPCTVTATHIQVCLAGDIDTRQCTHMRVYPSICDLVQFQLRYIR